MPTMVLLVLLAQAYPDPPEGKVLCTSVGGPVQLGTKEVTVGMKCCPPGMYVADADRPALDAKGELICSRDL